MIFGWVGFLGIWAKAKELNLFLVFFSRYAEWMDEKRLHLNFQPNTLNGKECLKHKNQKQKTGIFYVANGDDRFVELCPAFAAMANAYCSLFTLRSCNLSSFGFYFCPGWVPDANLYIHTHICK